MDVIGWNLAAQPARITIESNGATTLAQSANQFYLLDSTGAGPSLKYHGVDELADRWSGWAPIGAEKTATGYEVAWKGDGVYEVWNTDNNGNFTSMPVADVPGSDLALQTAETSFQQDLNGDGHIGTGTGPTPIESNGATTLSQSANQFYLLDSSGAGPSLKYHGVDELADRWSGWAPIGAEKTATGYEVAWKGDGVYEVWNTDNNGNFTSMPVVDVPGSDPALQSAETSFQQDLNGDGHIANAQSVVMASEMPPHDWLL
jgi:serralysin